MFFTHIEPATKTKVELHTEAVKQQMLAAGANLNDVGVGVGELARLTVRGANAVIARKGNNHETKYEIALGDTRGFRLAGDGD